MIQEIQLKQTVKKSQGNHIESLDSILLYLICSSFFFFKIKRIPPATSAPSMPNAYICVFYHLYRHPFPLCPHFPYSELSQMYLPLKHQEVCSPENYQVY